MSKTPSLSLRLRFAPIKTGAFWCAVDASLVRDWCVSDAPAMRPWCVSDARSFHRFHPGFLP
jgi:hypothetical protein